MSISSIIHISVKETVAEGKLVTVVSFSYSPAVILLYTPFIVEPIKAVPDSNMIVELGLLYRLLAEVHLDCIVIRRVGSVGDGGWDLCTVQPYELTQDCLVYSFGYIYKLASILTTIQLCSDRRNIKFKFVFRIHESE